MTAFSQIAEAQMTQLESDYPIQPIPFHRVDLSDRFWARRLETNRKVTIPFAMRQNQKTGRLTNFAIAAGLEEGGFRA